ncbi:MAG: tRNA (adenosine(37)-N6)-threonylcarbamoyltransferase complex dimerization subunit type 1 TsaB [Planctomycetes bacterium]|nr:tRNA (adenosine(37)-N6)-threonylcarbamoyltransferase complex dimerization subunit type 1 TsaB [Planctomycetota bacterium]
MSEYGKPISIAIETTCRAGGLALGAGVALVEVAPFDASRRTATQVVTRLADLMGRHGLTADRIDEIYVSAGPGSFTGTRVGITVTRTLVQVLADARCVAVPTVDVVAENLRPSHQITNLAVVLDAGSGLLYATLFNRMEGDWVPVGKAGLATPAEFLANAPRPLHLTGEGLGYHNISAEGVCPADREYWYPRVENVWQIGRRLARAGLFTDPARLLPIYTGKPLALRKLQTRK